MSNAKTVTKLVVNEKGVQNTSFFNKKYIYKLGSMNFS